MATSWPDSPQCLLSAAATRSGRRLRARRVGSAWKVRGPLATGRWFIADGRHGGILARTSRLTRVLNRLLSAELNCHLNTDLRPELAGCLSRVFTSALRTEFSRVLRGRLESDFIIGFKPELSPVLKGRFRPALGCGLRPEVTPEVTPLLITQVPMQVPC